MKQLPPVAPRYRVPRVGPYARLTVLWAFAGLGLGFGAALLHLAYVAPVLLAIFGWFAYRRIRITGAAHAIRGFTAPMKRGDLDELGALAERVLPRARSAPGLLAVVVMTRAYVFLRQGDADVAASLFREVEASRWLSRSQKHPQLSFFYRNAALAAALRTTDDEDAVEVTRLLELAESNSEPRDSAAQTDMLLARVILALKAEKPAEAIELLPRPRKEPELQLLRVLALRALARPSADELAELSETAAKPGAASLLWLGSDWPALHALLPGKKES
jgi:hypothetical protein